MSGEKGSYTDGGELRWHVGSRECKKKKGGLGRERSSEAVDRRFSISELIPSTRDCGETVC